ncbi:MAG: LCP family protein [Spirochaetes bacterium]|nr:LCP family protein [Spirochaetota bacterium]
MDGKKIELKKKKKEKINPKFISFGITLLLAVVLLILLYLYFYYYFFGGRINTYVEKKEMISILFIGLDDADDHKKADTLLLGLYNPPTKRFGLVALPRDLKVEVEDRAGLKTMKINSLYSKYGSGKLLKIVRNLTGIDVKFHVAMEISALVKIIDLIGGVELYIDNEMKYVDKAANLFIELPKGIIKCDGLKAMEFIRYRNDDRGDMGRIERQYEFILNLLKKAVIQKDLLSNLQLIKILYKNVDTNLNFKDIINLIRYSSHADFNNVDMIKVPGKFLNLYGTRYIEPDITKSKRVISNFIKKMTYTISDIIPQEIKVQVLNGSGKGGVAKRIRDKLVRNGYNVVEFGNAESQDYEEMLILDRSGNMKKALKVASLLKCKNVFPKINKFILIDSTIIVGKDYKKYW